MQIVDQKIEVLKEGIQIEGHKCESRNWANKIDYNTPDDIQEFTRICKVCGRIEHVKKQMVIETFDSIYENFHGKE